MSLKGTENSLASIIAQIRKEGKKKGVSQKEIDEKVKYYVEESRREFEEFNYARLNHLPVPEYQEIEITNEFWPDYAPKKKNGFVRFLRSLLGLFAGVIVWQVVCRLLIWLLSILGNIPFIGAILFFPSDAAWSLIVIPPSTSVFAGALCALAVGKSSKTFSVFIIITYILSIIASIANKTITLSAVLFAVVAIGTAAICIAESDE